VGHRPGFDCSGLVVWAVWQASGGKLNLPHSSELQATMGQAIDPSGTEGTVLKEVGGFWSVRYLMTWDNKEVLEVFDAEIRRIPSSVW
jgi:cell wall-associated NlpC family hydrolase